MHQLIQDILKQEFTGQMMCDNQVAIRVSTAYSAHKRVWHVDREFYLTNQVLFCKKTGIIWVPKKLQVADVLTKTFPKDSFLTFWNMIM